VPKKRHPQRSYVRASILHLPFKVFSLTFTVDVLQHIPPNRREEAIKEINRVSLSSYHFLDEHRTYITAIFELLRNFTFKPLKIVIPILSFFSFPIRQNEKIRDRTRK
jgi:hypothetical protein